MTGSFTKWDTPVPLRRSAETNDFIRTIALEPGTYQVSMGLCSPECAPK
jgi:hypothetical protein